MSSLIDPDHAMSFLDFVQERHRIWERRQRNEPQPWTDDPVLASHKFTCVFRVLDPGSQFVINDLLHGDPEDVLLRVFLYRHTGSLPAWRQLLDDIGEYPDRSNLQYVWHSWAEWRTPVNKVFTGVYNINPFSVVKGTDKLANIMAFAKHHFIDHTHAVKEFFAAQSQEARYYALNDLKGVGKFMAMQVLTDYGYATKFNENRFIVAGPGARRGAQYVSDMKPEDTIVWAWRAIQNADNPPTVLGKYLPSLLDVQNCFCEYSKYVRFNNRPATHVEPYRPLNPGPQPLPVMPRNW